MFTQSNTAKSGNGHMWFECIVLILCRRPLMLPA